MQSEQLQLDSASVGDEPGGCSTNSMLSKLRQDLIGCLDSSREPDCRAIIMRVKTLLKGYDAISDEWYGLFAAVHALGVGSGEHET